MKTKLTKKTAFTTILLTLLVLSALSTSLLAVKADPTGIGKFLTVEIQGEGYVTATKVNSGETWTYTKTTPPTEHKLGAGTVTLHAYSSEGWEFSHWQGNLTGTENPTEYKSEKYGYIIAVFQKKVFTITAVVAEEASNGTIQTEIDGETITIDEKREVIVEYGSTQTFDFIPNDENHVSAIQVNNSFAPYSLSYSFNNIQADWTLTVYFSLNGQAYVPAGSNVPVYLGDNVGLNFTSTEGGGTATQAEIILDAHPLLQETSLILWEISVEATFTGTVQITIPYSGTQTIQRVWTSNDLNALYSDVNGDGVIDGDDVSDVAVGIKTTVASGAEYNAKFDVNRDGQLTEDDVHMVNLYKGTTLQSLTFLVIGNSLFIQTSHFSIFRAR